VISRPVKIRRKEDKYSQVSIDLHEFSTGNRTPIWNLEKKPGWGLSMARDVPPPEKVSSETR
jgi:hypothetical protein